jgi:hypothetical protein
VVLSFVYTYAKETLWYIQRNTCNDGATTLACGATHCNDIHRSQSMVLQISHTKPIRHKINLWLKWKLRWNKKAT